MINEIECLYGRQIRTIDIDSGLLNHPKINKRSAISMAGNQIICQRCGQKTDKQIAQLPNNHFYCPQCINLGRMSTLHSLCSINEPNHFPINDNPLTWDGQLTTSQEQCSKEVISRFKNNQDQLLWAVTGAGKTEMLFPGIEWAIRKGFRICIASPRVDVCIELMPRLQTAFSNVSIVILHGKQEEEYHYAQLTICTTHQLLRFYHAFDILIIDEVDSFPYVNDPGLHYAVNNALKISGRRLYLTATPSPDLLKQISKKQLAVSYLPLRFHQHLLPKINLHCKMNWHQKLEKGKLPGKLLTDIHQRLNDKIRFLIFVPKIKDLSLVDRAIRKNKVQGKWQTVYSADPKRLEKVQAMRKNELDFLITTTILERGVTFPGIDVIVLGADDPVFSTSSLVQIAGRVGRKQDRPTGNVDFWAAFNNRRINKARRQILHMNYLGEKLRDGK